MFQTGLRNAFRALRRRMQPVVIILLGCAIPGMLAAADRLAGVPGRGRARGAGARRGRDSARRPAARRSRRRWPATRSSASPSSTPTSLTSTGYSGKPIHIVAGIDPAGADHRHRAGRAPGADRADRHPGGPGGRGDQLARSASTCRPWHRGRQPLPQVDIVSGATVTVLVMGDSVAPRRDRGGAERAAGGPAAPERRRGRRGRAGAALAGGEGEIRDWEDARRRRLGAPAVADRRRRQRGLRAIGRRRGRRAARAGRPRRDLHRPLYRRSPPSRRSAAACSARPATGRCSTGSSRAQHAIVVAGEGRYSFKGSGYVRGGIFDRIELIQDVEPLRFRDRDHTPARRMSRPRARRTSARSGLFRDPGRASASIPAEPWPLQLLVQRAIGRARQGLPDVRAALHACRSSISATAAPAPRRRRRPRPDPRRRRGAGGDARRRRRRWPAISASRSGMRIWRDEHGRDRHRCWRDHRADRASSSSRTRW